MPATSDDIMLSLAVIGAQLRALQASVDAIQKQGDVIVVTVADLQAKAQAELDQLTAETDMVNAVKLVVENQNSKLEALQAQIDQMIASGGADATALQTLSDTID